jgi:hypothetical protein
LAVTQKYWPLRSSPSEEEEEEEEGEPLSAALPLLLPLQMRTWTMHVSAGSVSVDSKTAAAP